MLSRISLVLVLLGVVLLSACNSSRDPYATWRVYLGDASSSQYSSLDQINRDNVDQLEVAWTYRSDTLDGVSRTQIQCNPIIIDDVLYGTSAHINVFALNAATGEEIWRFDPFEAGAAVDGIGVSRGLVYWADRRGRNARILVTAGSRLFALDAHSGRPIPEFGDNGSLDLHDGLDRDVTGMYVQARTPGIVYKDLLIQGSSLSEGPVTAPGHIRAYDVRTGEIRWIFHTIPHPGEFGYETWPENAYLRIGGANVWTGMALDEERGIVYAPTGSAAFDFWGGNRKGENLFANTLLALDAETGEHIWHYQFVHHDIWDRDLPSPPSLITLERKGRRVDAVAQATKSGHVFVFDRETGEPLFPIEERPVPPSDLKGEEAWPTQPFPTKPPPFARQSFSEGDLTDISPEARASVVDRFRRSRKNLPYVPPSVEGTLIFPGYDGAAEWGGSANVPGEGILYLNSNEMPWILEMVELAVAEGEATGRLLYQIHCAGCHGFDHRGSPDGIIPSIENVTDSLSPAEISNQIAYGKGVMPSFGFLSEEERHRIVTYLLNPTEDRGAPPGDKATEDLGEFAGSAYGHTGYNRFLDKDGYPAVKPPWGTLNAIDLNAGEIEWQSTLGEFPELTEKGIPPTGTENYGGPVVTGGDVLFIAATHDSKFRAFDRFTGEKLWETTLPAGGYATPATYEVDGRQYVVIAAGGGKGGTKRGDSYVAFALPLASHPETSSRRSASGRGT